MGAPTDYKDTYPEELIQKMSEGLLDIEVISDWDISENTFFRWLREKPELKAAYEIGYPKCFKWWSTEGRKKFLASDDKGHKYWQAIMKNKFHFDREPSKTNNTTINVNNMNVLAQKSDTELLSFIQTQLKKQNLIDHKNNVIDVDPFEDAFDDEEPRA